MNKKTLLSLLTGCVLTAWTPGAFGGTPFNGPHTVPCVVQAEDYDQGGEGVAWYVPASSTSRGDITYRGNDKVWLVGEEWHDGYAVRCDDYQAIPVEWLKYTVTAPITATYNITLYFTRVDGNGGKVTTLLVNGTKVGADAPKPVASESTSTYFTLTNIPLVAGVNELTFQITQGDFDKFEIWEYLGTPAGGTAQSIPGVLEAAKFDDVVNEDIATGKENAGTPEEYPIIFIENGQEVSYTINVPKGAILYTYPSYQATGEGELTVTLDFGMPIQSFDIAPTAAGEWNYDLKAKANYTAGQHYLTLKYTGTGTLTLGDFLVDTWISSYSGTPYRGPHTIPCRVECEDWDVGALGETWYDTGVGDNNSYRSDNNGVDVNKNTSDTPGEGQDEGWHVGSTAADEFLCYTVVAPEDGMYEFTLRAGSPAESPRDITILINGESAGLFTVVGEGDTNDGDWGYTSNYVDHKFLLPLVEGNNVVTFYFTRINVDYFTIAKSDALGAKTIAELNPDLYYDFEATGDFTAPRIGDKYLGFYKAAEDFRGEGTALEPTDLTAQPTFTAGPNADKKAIIVPRDLNIKVLNPTTTVPLSSYTLLYDIQFGPFNMYKNYHCLVTTNMANDGDGSVFAGRGGNVGQGGYNTRALEPYKWYRVAIVYFGAEGGDAKAKIYVDGVFETNLPQGAKLGDFQDYLWIFTDEDGEDGDQNIANFAVWSRALSEAEVAALGNAGSTVAATPYTGTPATIPGLIEAADFDKGANGEAYYAIDPSQGGANNSIRTDVDLAIRADEGMGVNYIILNQREMAQYTIVVSEENTYSFDIGVSGVTEDGTLNIYIDNAYFTKTIEAYDGWQYATLTGVGMTAGKHTMQLIWIGTGSVYISDLYIDVPGAVNVDPTLQYDFEDAADLGKPTIGDTPLEITGTITQIDGVSATDKAVAIPQDAYMKVINPRGPAVTGKQLTTFTMLYDYRVSGYETGYRTFFQAREANDGDATAFIRPNDGAIGIGGHYTSSPYMAQNDVWQRVIFSWNDGLETTFVNGKTGYSGGWDVKLDNFFWIFRDNDGEDHPMDVSRFVFWADVALNQLDLKRAGLDGDPMAIRQVVENDGKVYAANGNLYVKGFSAAASVEVYSLVGSKVATVRSLNGKAIALPSNGLYIVKVTDNGKTAGFKVLSK